MLPTDHRGWVLPDWPLGLHEHCVRLLAGGALAVRRRGELVALNVGKLLRLAAEAPEAATEAPAVADAAPRTLSAEEKLAVCKTCENWSVPHHGCGLVTVCGDDVTAPEGPPRPCWTALRERMLTGKPCPHPAGDRWSV